MFQKNQKSHTEKACQKWKEWNAVHEKKDILLGVKQKNTIFHKKEYQRIKEENEIM